MQTAYSAANIFDGERWLADHAMIVSDHVIEKILPATELPADINQSHFEQCTIVPAFIDVQVYGANDKLFSVYPDAATLHIMQQQFTSEGTVLFQPTLATNTIEVFKKGIDAVRVYWSGGGKGVHGVHLEGPWLNVGKRGAHVQELIHSPDIAEVAALLEYGAGVITMITVAPEVCSDAVLKLLTDSGIVVSAGHSNSTFSEAMNAFEKGISAGTHLFNAMSQLHHRQPGLVGAAFQHPTVRFSIIPDGFHVDFAAITIAKKAMGERLFAITDAVTTTNEGAYQHKLVGDKYECNGTLSGSALSMHKAFKNLVKYVGIDTGEAARMCSLYPAQVLRVDDRYGRLAAGYAANAIVLNEEYDIETVLG